MKIFNHKKKKQRRKYVINEKEIHEKKQKRKWIIYHILELISEILSSTPIDQLQKMEQLPQIEQIKEIDIKVNGKQSTTETNNSSTASNNNNNK